MYLTIPSRDRTELWVSDVDGGSKTKLSEGKSLATATWAPDDSRLAFFSESEEQGKSANFYTMMPDGSGIQTYVWPAESTMQSILWSTGQKTFYVNAWEKGAVSESIWQQSADGPAREKLADGCGFAFDVSPDGKYLLSLVAGGDKIGIFSFAIADRKCTMLVPGVVTFGLNIEKDGKSFLYAVPGKKDVTIYRQKWEAGKAVGQPQEALKLPFAFPLVAGGNAYDFSRDLTTVVFARVSGHSDLYLMRDAGE
jgi:hypothetical protein